MDKRDGQQASTEEVVASLAYQIEALIAVLEAKGVLTRDELKQKIRELLSERPS